MIAASGPDTHLDLDNFRALADLAYRESGLILVEEKKAMIQSRLRHRLKALTLPNFNSYSAFVTSDAGRSERRQLISALTTNVSHFFREDHHFDTLVTAVIKDYLPRLKSGGRLRIWSAGCSNGQEACSALIRLLERAPELATCDLRILGTDIDPKVVEFARTGIYSQSMIADMAEPLRTKYFEKVTGSTEPAYRTKDILRNMIRFNELNLLSNWPMKRPFDMVFCRNVVIYFDVATQQKLWPRFKSVLAPGGYLFLGHSERIQNPEFAGFYPDGPTTYRLGQSSNPEKRTG